MKKIISFCTVLITIFILGIPATAEGVNISAQSAIVIEASTGEVLYSKNAHEKRPMASTTKIMTTLLCLESGDLDEEFVVDPDAIKVEGSSMGLVEGDVVTKRALCIGMLLPSGNDAANATAIKLAGSYTAFADMMNARACEIGMNDTCFVTPSGLHDDNHLSTAYDMAMLSRVALQNEEFQSICSQKSMKVNFGNPPYERWLFNSNKLLSMYPNCIGVKTGFTDEAKRCLVSAVEKDGTTLICVTLNAPNDWQDHTALYDNCFKRVSTIKIDRLDDFRTDVVGGVKDEILVGVDEDVYTSSIDGKSGEIVGKCVVDPFVYAPVKLGDKVGRIEYYCNGMLIDVIDLKALESCDMEEIPLKEKSIFDKIMDFINTKKFKMNGV